MLRIALSWCAAVVLASLLPALAFAVVAFDGRIRVGHATGTAFAVAFMVALPQVLVLGVPVAAGLRRRGRFTPVRMLLAGFLAGALACALFLLWQSGGVPAAMAGLWSPVVAMIVAGAGGFGMLSALGLWAVLRAGLPSPWS